MSVQSPVHHASKLLAGGVAWGGSTSGSALGTRLLSNRNIISSAFGTQSSVRQ